MSPIRVRRPLLWLAATAFGSWILILALIFVASGAVQM